MSKKTQDHQTKKPTAAQLAAQLRQAQQEEANKKAEFTKKYNDLCREYGLAIKPELTITVVPLLQ